MAEFIADERLLRAAFALCNQPAPLNEDEVRRRDERHNAARRGGVIRLTAEDIAAQDRDALAARARVLQAQFRDDPANRIEAVLAATTAMNAAGQSIGYRLGESSRPWNDGLADLSQKHPGFPPDLYRAALQSGTNQSFR